MAEHANDVPVGLIPQTQTGAPVTPQPSHASIPQGTTDAVAKAQTDRVKHATGSMTPPPSTQVPSNVHAKSRTPTPSGSHISTPPPTVDTLSQDSISRPIGGFARAMTIDQIANASAEELRSKVAEVQAAYQEANMSAAHHKLQYQMLAQESAAAIERMAVEARMVQCENEVIHIAEQAKATTAPILSSPIQEGTIPVQKDLYQRMCREIQHLSETNIFLESEHREQEKVIFRQDNEIAGLSDKVLMMRDRIREHRDSQHRVRSASLGRNLESTPMSAYTTPRRPQASMRSQPQPFAALLEASAMASQEADTGSKPQSGRASGKKGHSRNIHSLSSLPVTPNRTRKQPPLFQTPQGKLQQAPVMPSTAPVPRTSNVRTPDVYAQQTLPVKRSHNPGSDGTVSASDNEGDHDSEAETEILEHDQIPESSASFSAAQMLRANPEPHASQLEERSARSAKRSASGSLRQGKLFGAVRKPNIVRAGEDELAPPAKRSRMLEGIGLGIEGVGH